MLQYSGTQRRKLFSVGDLLFLFAISAAGFAVGLIGIRHYGYIGQDFAWNQRYVLSFPEGWSYALTNPPGFYWFGSIIRNNFGLDHWLGLNALAYLILNTLALWIVYGLLWRCISRTQLRCAAAAFATFVPFRVIHAIVLASDGFTLPVFAVAALFTFRLLGDPRSLLSWAGLSAGLLVGMFFKYTFAGLLPPVALVLGVAIWRRLPKGERAPWIAIGILALALPSGALVIQARESAKAGSYSSTGQWLPKGSPSVMRWSDMLTLKASDVRLLSAPDYLQGMLFGFRTYSYLGLLHVSSFSDVLNCFQRPPETVSPDWYPSTDELKIRPRTHLSQALQTLSVRWCLGFSALAMAGTLYCILRSARWLVQRGPAAADAIVVLTALAVGFYSPIFLSLHRVAHPYTAGYWTPRLILPALLVFFCLGFVLLDAACGLLEREKAPARPLLLLISAYTLVACLLFIGFLPVLIRRQLQRPLPVGRRLGRLLRARHRVLRGRRSPDRESRFPRSCPPSARARRAP